MYIHLGNNKILNEKQIIGIFDLDSATKSKNTRKTLNRCQKAKKVEPVSYDIPRSFILTKDKIYLSSLSSKALYGRTGNQ